MIEVKSNCVLHSGLSDPHKCDEIVLSSFSFSPFFRFLLLWGRKKANVKSMTEPRGGADVGVIPYTLSFPFLFFFSAGLMIISREYDWSFSSKTRH